MAGVDIANHNMEYLKLTPEQYQVHVFFMGLNMGDFPVSLRQYLSEQSKIYGFSGDCASVWIADWIKDKWLE